MRYAYVIVLFSILFANSSFAQQPDSLSLDKCINWAISSYPTVMQAQEALKMANTRVQMAKSKYLPNVDAGASFTRIGPIPSVEFNGASFDMAPAMQYSATISANQLIYDFGKTKSEQNIEEQGRNIASLSLDEVKQKLSLAVVNTYLSILYLQNAREIKDEQLKNLNEHLDFVVKKKETGSATEYEILTTKVRISNIESQKTDIETFRAIQQSVMNTLLGNDINTNILVSKSIPSNVLLAKENAFYAVALKDRTEIKIATEKTTVATTKMQLSKKQAYPSLGLFANGGYKDGYFPNLSSPKFNYVVGMSFDVPLFNGHRIKNSTNLAQSSLLISRYDEELTRRNVTSEVTEALLNVKSAKVKIAQMELQCAQAAKALSLANVSFKSGAITNLDLLDATTSLSESRLNLLKAQIDYTTSLYRLKMAIGENIY